MADVKGGQGLPGAGQGPPGAVALPAPPVLAQPKLLFRLFNDTAAALDELNRTYGPVVGLGAGPMRLAVVGEPAAIGDLFAEHVDAFRWNHPFNPLQVLVGEGSLIVSDGPEHRRRRSAVQGGFSRRRLDGWMPMVLERTDSAVDRLLASLPGDSEAGKSPVVDIYPFGRMLILEIVIRALFGERLGAMSAEIGALFQQPQDYLEQPAYKQLPHPFPWGARGRLRRNRAELDGIISREVTHLRTSPEGDELNVLEAMVTDGTLSDAEIRDQIVSLIGAGYDTTSAALAWLLLSVAEKPSLWDRLASEADAALGAAAGRFTPQSPG